MARPYAVRVRRLADDAVQDMPYKAFLYIQDDVDDVTHQKKFELIGEVDANGKLVPGSPNLNPQHQTSVPQPVQKSAEVAGSVGEQKPAEQAQTPATQKRRGRPAQVKLQETQA